MQTQEMTPHEVNLANFQEKVGEKYSDLFGIVLYFGAGIYPAKMLNLLLPFSILMTSAFIHVVYNIIYPTTCFEQFKLIELERQRKIASIKTMIYANWWDCLAIFIFLLVKVMINVDHVNWGYCLIIFVLFY
jgi:hypothetical protein